MNRISRLSLALLSLLGTGLFATACSSSSSSTSTTVVAPATVSQVVWMNSYDSPGTPAQYNKVGVVKIGSPTAKNVLVLEPGTSGGSGYFEPLGRWIVSANPSWQVWSVERRENLLENQSDLNLYKQHKITSAQLYNYYLGYLKNPAITNHYQPVNPSTVTFAKQWGLNVAVEDLHTVIAAAHQLGGKVVLGGHSLGGAVVTAYATWDFNGTPGADGLAGLVFIDGASENQVESATAATTALDTLNAPSSSPWLVFGGIPAPFAGLFESTGAGAAYEDPNSASLAQTSGLLPAAIVPPVPATNLGLYGYALNTLTSPPSLAAAQGHLGAGLTDTKPLAGWNSTGALSPIRRFATMFYSPELQNADGVEWYFPQRLTDDSATVDNGNANPAQSVLGVKATMGHDLPKTLLMYAFGAKLFGVHAITSTEALAAQSGIPAANLTLVDRQSTYAHNDPAAAYPTNDFYQGLLPFLKKIG